MGKRKIKDDQFEINAFEIKARERENGLDYGNEAISQNTNELKRNRDIDVEK